MSFDDVCSRCGRHLYAFCEDAIEKKEEHIGWGSVGDEVMCLGCILNLIGDMKAEITRLERRFLEETANHDRTRHRLECRERELERIRSNMYKQRVEDSKET